MKDKRPWEKIDIEQQLKINPRLYESTKMYRLWFEYLRLSPSFAYAEKMKRNKLTEEEKANPPVEFELVQEVYKNFKAIYEPFWLWWITSGTSLFAKHSLYHDSKPKTKKIALIKPNRKNDYSNCLSKVEKHLENIQWTPFHRSELLISVPIDFTQDIEITTKDIQEFLEKELLNLNENNKLRREKHDSKKRLGYKLKSYELLKSTARYDTLESGLRVLWTLAENPSLPLYRIGQLANISGVHRNLVIPEKYKYSDFGQQVESLKVSTSRFETKALTVMENAARGRFPCTDKIKIPNIDYHEMNRIKLAHEVSDKIQFDEIKDFKNLTHTHRPADIDVVHFELFGY